ncbi:MBL fold metallo-hydrolase [uncultured Tateyamaria sp.]|uniref:MBL fold metallo-hydrolase n=1 Tax=uncultured Tateyamaria sp. TaxID=455651 RepID=UPI00262D6F1C|nr:MBL fold metallo-hydrolase [uncultured Tateyamaria sp.]
MLPSDDFDPPIGISEVLELGLRRIVAPNPSPMTYRGTNTYLVGTTALAVIDPGPDSAAHLDAVMGAIGSEQFVSHIIVTHAHLDHSPLAAPLSKATGAPVLAFGTATDGRSSVMQGLADNGLVGGGEGVDISFAPNTRLRDGDVINGPDWHLDVIHTPGHLGNHICLGFGDACLTADHVMGWASSLVSPPDGDLTDFMASCEKLRRRRWRVFYPGHGGPVIDPTARLEWLIAHRRTREAAILATLDKGPATAVQIAQLVYVDTPKALLPAATRNVLAHLIDLMGRSEIEASDPLAHDARFARIGGV